MATNKKTQPKSAKTLKTAGTPKLVAAAETSSRTLATAKVLRAILLFPTVISVLYACYYAYTLLAMPISGRVAAVAYLAVILPIGALATAFFIVFTVINLKKRNEELKKYSIHILIFALLMVMWPILIFIAAMVILLFRKVPLL